MQRERRPDRANARTPGSTVQRKKSRTSNLVQRRYAGVTPRAAATPSVPQPTQTPSSAALPDPFDFSYAVDPITTAQAGVGGASEPLPYLGAIQSSFEHHDVTGVRASSGVQAQQANAALGAQAYATGDRVAFGATPTLHTAAHEAAHVVQQRAGVSLKAGVGESGDAYEQHADRVADLVVNGQSAAAALDEMAGPTGGTTDAVQRFDSPHHVEIGNSVDGESVTIDGVTFSPGELSALLDYVGPLTVLESYKAPALTKMKELLAAGNENAAEWDEVTNGSYSKLSQTNEDHFAPGDGDSANFESSFIGFYTQALVEGARAKAAGESMDKAYLHLYSAEHYLHDAFSAGHQVSQDQIVQGVDALLGPVNSKLLLPLIANDVWDRKSDVIRQYGWKLGPVDKPLTLTDFTAIATTGGLVKGDEGFYAGIRKYVHEQLDDMGVEVSSPAHPTPWVIHGDHSLIDPGEGGDTSIAAMQAAMSEFRAMVDINASIPTTEPEQMATELFAEHRPVPTGNSQAAIDKIVTDATSSNSAIIDAMVDAMCDTITGVMDTIASMIPGLVKLVGGEDGDDTQPFPDIPPEGGTEDNGSYLPYPPDRLGQYPTQ